MNPLHAPAASCPPAHSSDTAAAVARLVEDQFVDTYLRNSGKAQIGLFLSAVVAALIWNGRAHSVWPLVWLAVFGLVTGWRYLKTADFVLAGQGNGRFRRVELTLLVNGILMAAPLSAFAAYTELERMAISIILMATATASTTTTSGYRSVFLAFALPMLAPLALAWALAPHPDATWLSTWGISVLILFYLGFLVNVARQVAAVFVQSCQYRLGEQQTNLQLKAALDVADESNRAKTQFLAAASHDLRQPLHSINVLVATLSLRPLDADTQDIVRLLDSVNQTMSRQLDTLLDLSKLDAGVVVPHMASHRLDTLALAHAKALAPVATAQGVKLVADNAPAIAVTTDDVLLRRVLSNLTDNALKFTPSGGSLRLSVWQADGQAHLSVADSGIGIPPEAHHRVFQAFFQLGNAERDRQKGLGLGLSIVQRLCNLMGISLRMESAPGMGTTITLSWPLASTLPATAGSTPLQALAPVKPGLTVLVLDDDATVRQSMRLFLRQLGCQVLEASDTAHAVTLATQHPVNVLLTDQRLKGDDTGIAAIEQVRAVRPDMTAAIVTGDTAPDRLQAALSTQVPVLHKPVSLDKLTALLAGVPATAVTVERDHLRSD
ncbi:MAG TPA: ATP-binding protein [Burkholderiaceae bacterium]|nr:ATP-binding protein [Burkholderiaceae bacterium]